jgi:hypothetical protein
MSEAYATVNTLPVGAAASAELDVNSELLQPDSWGHGEATYSWLLRRRCARALGDVAVVKSNRWRWASGRFSGRTAALGGAAA